jgi:hypothetical protein
MSPYRSAAMLKAMARGQLLGKYPIAAATFMTVVMITMIMRLFFATLLGSLGAVGFIFSTITSFIISLILGVVNVGILFMALKICCREPISPSDVFYGFRNQPEKILMIQAVFSGVSLVAMLPADILRLNYNTSDDSLPMIIAFYIAGMAVYLFVSLILSQVFFLLLDFEDKSAKELISMAYMVMNGHKKRFFLLWLGFVPLLLVGVLTCFIGFIWIIPLIKVTQANFYMDLMQNRE